MAGMARSILLGLALLAAPALMGCGTLENSAAKDPMKCERDPKCKKNDKANDCSTQCADDPACVDRCREIQTQTGTMGR
jgi:hypothetical protein